MKRFSIFMLIFAAVFSLSSCKVAQPEQNITRWQRFIYCDDPDCEVCHGTGTFTCTDCGGSGTVTCSKCGGSGQQDCTGGMALLGLTCEGGYYKPSDPANPNGFDLDPRGYVIDHDTGRAMECAVCGGTGTVECSRCDGDGLVTCSTCEGSGEMAHGSYEYFMVCSACGTELEDGATTCTNCGMNATVYVCKECGAMFNEEFDVCPECGAGE